MSWCIAVSVIFVAIIFLVIPRAIWKSLQCYWRAIKRLWTLTTNNREHPSRSFTGGNAISVAELQPITMSDSSIESRNEGKEQEVPFTSESTKVDNTGVMNVNTNNESYIENRGTEDIKIKMQDTTLTNTSFGSKTESTQEDYVDFSETSNTGILNKNSGNKNVSINAATEILDIEIQGSTITNTNLGNSNEATYSEKPSTNQDSKVDNTGAMNVNANNETYIENYGKEDIKIKIHDTTWTTTGSGSSKETMKGLKENLLSKVASLLPHKQSSSEKSDGAKYTNTSNSGILNMNSGNENALTDESEKKVEINIEGSTLTNSNLEKETNTVEPDKDSPPTSELEDTLSEILLYHPEEDIQNVVSGLNTLGVYASQDLMFVELSDLTEKGIKIVQARKLCAYKDHLSKQNENKPLLKKLKHNPWNNLRKLGENGKSA